MRARQVACFLRDMQLQAAAPVLALLLAATAPAETLRVTAPTTSLRAQPSADADLLASLEKGNEVEVLERLGGWCRVNVAAASSEALVGLKGYVAISDLESLPGSAPAAPAEPAKPEPEEAEPTKPEPEEAEPA